MADVPILLFVEAETEPRHVVARFLERLGTVLTATTLQDARRALAKRPEILVLDPDLPDGDGAALIPELRRVVPWSQVCVVCSLARAGETAAFIEAGANDVITRPFDVGAFVPRLERACRALHGRRDEFDRIGQLEARMRHVDGLAMLGTMLATVAHEVASPLTAIQGNADLMRAQALGPEPLDHEARKELADSAREVGDAVKAIQAYLARVRGLSKREPAAPMCAPLCLAIDSAMLLLKQKILLSGVTVHRPSLGTTPTVQYVPIRLAQALTNAVANAIEAAGSGGHVWISVSENDDEAALVVDDDGPGLSGEAGERILEPFFTTKPTGTGLGMSVIKDVMREHGGRLELGSRESGSGLRVRLVLPRR